MRVIGYKKYQIGKVFTIIGAVGLGLSFISIFGLIPYSYTFISSIIGSGVPFLIMFIIGLVYLNKKTEIIYVEGEHVSFLHQSIWQKVNRKYIKELRLSGTIIYIIMEDDYQFKINSVNEPVRVINELNSFVFGNHKNN